MIRVVELFAGYGSQHVALNRIKNDKLIRDFDFEVVGIAEIEPKSNTADELLHVSENNLGDITKIDELPDCDLLTYSFPCQDLSNANVNGKGLEGEKSGLVYEVLRLLKRKQPKYLLMENVKALVNKNNIGGFNAICKRLEGLGYSNHWKVLNAKDQGSCQRRERVLMVSILGGDGLFKFNNRIIYPLDFDTVLEDTKVNGRIEKQIRVVNFLMKNEKLEAGRIPIHKVLNENFLFEISGNRMGSFGFNEIPTLLCGPISVSFGNIIKTKRMTPLSRYLAIGLT